ncbi:MAG: hypothetical protein NUV64_03110 [Parcubacteria group bacterium]|nr:hypothetical protein [Parcubacteria group bacterium]MCR4342398.1 hypothetical protein [Patescibacteria group bacterium]
MKSLFLLLFSFITKREVMETKSFEELCAVAGKLCIYRKSGLINRRLNTRYIKYIVRKAATLELSAEETRDIAKIISGLSKRAGGTLVKIYIHKKTVYAKDLPFLLGLGSESYPEELRHQLTKTIEKLVMEARVGHGDLLILAGVLRGENYTGYGSIQRELIDPSVVEEIVDSLALSTEFVSREEAEKYKELIRAPFTMSDIRQRIAEALAENDKVYSFDEAIGLLHRLNALYDEGNSTRCEALVKQAFVLAEKEITSLECAYRMLSLFDPKDTCLGIKNGIMAKTMSLIPKSKCLSFDDLAFFINNIESSASMVTKKIMENLLKTTKLQAMTVDDAINMASRFKKEDIRYVFLRLYVEEIWKPNFSEALILWRYYEDIDDFPKDEMDTSIFSALERDKVEFGAKELIRTQIWKRKGDKCKHLKMTVSKTEKIEMFIKEVVEESKALSA